MKKKISVHDLELGMFVSELDRPWLETPFLFQGFEIRSQNEITELKRYCQSVYILIADERADRRGLGPVVGVRKTADIMTSSDQQKRIEFELYRRVAIPSAAESCYPDVTTVEEEVQSMRAVHEEARTLIRAIMDDVRVGRTIPVHDARKVVARLAASVIRNPDALVCFSQLRSKDEYTALHSLRVAILALVFGRHLGLDIDALNVLGLGALLHDIGKMKVPNDILNKPDPLTPEEYRIVQTHVPVGVAILEHTANVPQAAIEVARCHHERHDGSGYVSGMRSDQIGLFGQIGAIVDYYDAITSDRAYHTGLSAHIALRQMYTERGTVFHPERVEQFIQCMGIYPIGSIVEFSSGEVGVVVAMNRQRRLKPRVTLVLRPNAKPFEVPHTVDLMDQAARSDNPLEIERVVEPGLYGISAVDYLPVAVNH
ncbi:MAG: HD-GYP domain-containing protein [Pseudomonadota bacterium]|nr:HD-GYP domain-containing protein [Pseudomonadota bacterium]